MYDAESLDKVAHVKFDTKRHKSDRFNGNTESNKEVRISFQFMSSCYKNINEPFSVI